MYYGLFFFGTFYRLLLLLLSDVEVFVLVFFLLCSPSNQDDGSSRYTSKFSFKKT